MGRKRRRKVKQFNFRINSKIGWWASLIFCCLIIFVGLGYAIYTASIFKVKEVDIKTNMPLSRGLRERMKGKSLFSLDIKLISANLLKTHPEYKEIHVYREFPSSIVVEATKRIPFAQIKDRKYYPVDKEAVIVSEGESRPWVGLIPLEIGEYRRSFRKGSNVKSEKLEQAFDLIEALEDEELLAGNNYVEKINASHLEAIYFIFSQKDFKEQDWLPDQGVKIIVGKGDFGRKLKLFKNLISQELKDKMFSVNYIDLRFKRVYMDYKR
ncbi:MAG: hypothetical protein KAS05_00855 [Candidatus Omnitrophica bacterium]|nr:hypothetical protein [Candidatus Omnitrophota bacterium]